MGRPPRHCESTVQETCAFPSLDFLQSVILTKQEIVRDTDVEEVCHDEYLPTSYARNTRFLV